MPYELEKYFSEITTQKKLKSEFQSFENLKTQFSIAEISQCFAFISKIRIENQKALQADKAQKLEEELFLKKEKDFLSQFSSFEDQQIALLPYLKNMPFQAESKIASKLVIGQWWEETKK